MAEATISKKEQLSSRWTGDSQSTQGYAIEVAAR